MAKTRGTGLVMVWADIDPEFEADCKAAVAAMGKVGIRMTYTLTKQGFNPETLAYSVAAQFHGTLNNARSYTINTDEADELRTEIEALRKQQAMMATAAAKTKRQLDPGWLREQLTAAITSNAMGKSTSGQDTIDALFASIDKAIQVSSGLKQLPGD